jgi:hypothetical protein
MAEAGNGFCSLAAAERLAGLLTASRAVGPSSACAGSSGSSRGARWFGR